MLHFQLVGTTIRRSNLFVTILELLGLGLVCIFCTSSLLTCSNVLEVQVSTAEFTGTSTQSPGRIGSVAHVPKIATSFERVP
jgi:hypothetical protein